MKNMNIVIPTFSNPFSFHCLRKESGTNLNFDNCVPEQTSHVTRSKTEWSDVDHGQYIAVWHDNKWTRGVVNMESQVLIWLVDWGYYLRPDENIVYVSLPAEFKKLPTKVFEASIHGVVPIDKVLSEECEIADQISMLWNNGAIQKSQNLINSSTAIHFVPIAILSTKTNDVVLGDLYLEIPGEGIINFIEQMKLWPVFLQKNPKAYIDSLSQFYTSRRKHHACVLKPQVTSNLEFPTMNLTTSLEEYQTIMKSVPELKLEVDSDSDGCSTVVTEAGSNRTLHLTPSEIEEYSNMYIWINGREYNVLNVIINKMRDLNMCQKYKDLKSVGRATSRLRSRFSESFDSDEDSV